MVRGLVLGMAGAFAAGGVVVGLARTYVADLGGGDAGYGVLFGAVFVGMGLGLSVVVIGAIKNASFITRLRGGCDMPTVCDYVCSWG